MISDNRLFPGTLLYCEGRNKPTFRGKLHAIGVAALCPYWIFIASSSIDSLQEMFAMGMFIMGTFLCWGCSALYHCMDWTVKQEILIQRLDHSGIFLCIGCSFTPIVILLCQQANALVLLLSMVVTWSIAMYGIWHSCCKQQGIILLCVLNIALTVPVCIYVSSLLTNFEKLYGVLSIASYSLGAVVFGKQIIDPIPHIFGYHELFHLLTLIATCFAYLMYLSMSGDVHTRCDAGPDIIRSSVNLLFGFDQFCNNL